eukprot:c9428_g1_i1.p1 GENE.c9428_g1_i1~~c9428_g1_i1.p1  ORF type:complete len:1129 (-),score=330.43 c9428_g1_i1:112-3126(-)
MTVASERDKLEQQQQQSEPSTPAGDLKSFESEMAKAYNPRAVEDGWNSWWEKHYYQPGPTHNADGTPKEKFIIVIPPPNVTGSLHLGHALTLSIEDTLARWHRMNQKCVLWVPGCDHAGIATQVVVEKQIKKLENKTRWDYTREQFVSKVWEWKEQYGNRIYNQIRRMGASVDWTRAAFTMDDTRGKAVTEAFIRMFNNGVVYRGTRLNNWCSALRTAISDIEVDHMELEGKTMLKIPGHTGTYPFGVLTLFAYPVENSNEEIIVATTRPETMLGDTAVAIHPEDTRYTHLHGKFVVHPFNNRRIPIICDAELVKMEFGTGAVKVTPAHDPDDFRCGKRNGLPEINIFNNDGTVNENGAPFTGQMRFDCRLAIVAALKDKGLLRGEQDNKMKVPICSRSGDVIEPRLIPQWWVKCDQMASDAVKAVRTGELKIIPEQFKNTWYDWLENIQDWCISRQLWWGHRIPAFQIIIDGKSPEDDDMNHWVVGRTEEEALQHAYQKFPNVAKSSIRLEQDPDVLDTWFSSGLFPFSTMGWPDNTSDMANFFPTSLLETGHDILFFWVARMVMMSLHLTGQLPFKEVYLHAMVRDKYGRKMTKSLGNVVDPLEVVDGCSLEQLHARLYQGNLPAAEIEKAKEGQKLDFPQGIPSCGSDALRFGLIAYTMQGQDVNLDICRIVGYRNFCNKLWNATILMRMLFEDVNTPTGFATTDVKFLDSLVNGASLIDKWILSRLRHCILTVDHSFKQYQFGEGAHCIYHFFMDELCPVYLEAVKPLVRGGEPALVASIRKVLYTCFDLGLKLLHPMMPFVTEELWHRLPGMHTSKLTIMTQQYPTTTPESWHNAEAEAVLSIVDKVVHAVRSQKTAYKLLAQRPELFVVARTGELFDQVVKGSGFISSLGAVGRVTAVKSSEEVVKGCGVTVINKDLECHLLLIGLVDFAQEIDKLEKQKSIKEGAIDKLLKAMALPGYVAKAPADKIEQDKAKLEEYHSEVGLLQQAIDDLSRLLKA